MLLTSTYLTHNTKIYHNFFQDSLFIQISKQCIPPPFERQEFSISANTEYIHLLLPKPDCFFHCDGKLLCQGFVGLVFGEVEAVEAVEELAIQRKEIEGMNLPSVRLRQCSIFPRFLDRKPPRPITSLQILEPINRYTRSTRSKLK
jgi:hypothetical protein